MFIYKSLKNKLRGEKRHADVETSECDALNTNEKQISPLNHSTVEAMYKPVKQPLHRCVPQVTNHEKSKKLNILCHENHQTDRDFEYVLRKLKYDVPESSNSLMKSLTNVFQKDIIEKKPLEKNQEIKQLVEIECSSHAMKYIEKEFERRSVPCNKIEIETVKKLMKEGKVVQSKCFETKKFDFKVNGESKSDPENVVLFTIGDCSQTSKSSKPRRNIPSSNQSSQTICSVQQTPIEHTQQQTKVIEKPNSKDTRAKTPQQSKKSTKIQTRLPSPYRLSTFIKPENAFPNGKQSAAFSTPSLSTPEENTAKKIKEESETSKPIFSGVSVNVTKEDMKHRESNLQKSFDEIQKCSQLNPSLKVDPPNKPLSDRRDNNDGPKVATAAKSEIKLRRSEKKISISNNTYKLIPTTDNRASVTKQHPISTTPKNIGEQRLNTRVEELKGLFENGNEKQACNLITEVDRHLESKKTVEKANQIIWEKCFQNVNEMLHTDEDALKNKSIKKEGIFIKNNLLEIMEEVKTESNVNTIPTVKLQDNSNTQKQAPIEYVKLTDNHGMHQDISKGFLRFFLSDSQVKVLTDFSIMRKENKEANKNTDKNHSKKVKNRNIEKKEKKKKKKRKKGIKKEYLPEIILYTFQEEKAISEEKNEQEELSDTSIQETKFGMHDDELPATPKTSPTSDKLQKLRKSLDNLRQQSLQSYRFHWLTQFPDYKSKNLDTKVREEIPSESLYNFNSNLHRYIENATSFKMKTQDMFTSDRNDDHQRYEHFLTHDYNSIPRYDKIKTPEDYPGKQKKEKVTEDMIGLQIMLNKAFGQLPSDTKEKSKLNYSTSSTDFIPASPNTSLPGIDCSFIEATRTGVTKTYFDNVDDKQTNTIDSNSQYLHRPTNENKICCSSHEKYDQSVIVSESRGENQNEELIPQEQDLNASAENNEDVDEKEKQEEANKICDDIYKYLISKEDEMVVFDDDYDASEEYESDDNEDSICQLAIQELYEMSPTKTKYLGRADAITRVIFGKKELKRKKTKFGFTLKDCVILFKIRKKNPYDFKHFGFMACDTCCYTDNLELLSPLLQELHFNQIGQVEEYNLSKRELKRIMAAIDNDYPNIVECSLEMRRCLQNQIFPIANKNQKEKRKIQRDLRAACKTLDNRFQGRTVPLSFTNERIELLVEKKILKPERNVEQLSAASLYESNDVIILLNYLEHIHIIATAKGMNLKKVYADADFILRNMGEALKAAHQSFIYNRQLGYINPDPVHLGIACTLTIRVTLSHAAKIHELKEIMIKHGVELASTTWDDHNEDHIYNFRNRHQFGITEIDVLKSLNSFILLVSKINQRISEKGDYSDLIETFRTT